MDFPFSRLIERPVKRLIYTGDPDINDALVPKLNAALEACGLAFTAEAGSDGVVVGKDTGAELYVDHATWHEARRGITGPAISVIEGYVLWVQTMGAATREEPASPDEVVIGHVLTERDAVVEVCATLARAVAESTLPPLKELPY